MNKTRLAAELVAVIGLQVGLSRLLSYATSDATAREEGQYCGDPSPAAAPAATAVPPLAAVAGAPAA